MIGRLDKQTNDKKANNIQLKKKKHAMGHRKYNFDDKQTFINESNFGTK